ncbi:MAG: hypothetical protein PQJ61_06265 [Spirochaetales bacterium]|uniref:CN hydrolase domain-containing protein n=1 Tax=Candidatus Thalassospirochaeta sargassi TaxID=3119039 RepID=A0AAJ1IBX8_9SPIO|nr:hypothetical protein [Spirochaetales bacterium]
MKNNRLLLALSVLVLSAAGSASAESAGDGIFTAAGVQFEISTDIYQSEDSFFEAVEEYITDALEAEYTPDIIIFPEYIGVYYQLIQFNSIIFSHEQFQPAVVELLQQDPGYGSIKELFIQPENWKSYLDGWGRLAEEYETVLVAGSCFVSDDGEHLYNRTYVFGSDGKVMYSQDKVYLTEFEKGIVNLDAGRLENAGFFLIEGKPLALTICKDAYSTDWESKHAGAFLWIDIKANGEVYDTAQQQSFMRALPSRVMRSNVNFGMTVCTVGSYLDFFWEGESTAFYKTSEGLALADKSESHDRADTISISISMEQ